MIRHDLPDPRAQVQLVDIILGLLTLVPILVLAPVIYKFISMVTSRSDPFTSLLLSLVVPLLLLSVIVSLGVSARRGI